MAYSLAGKRVWVAGHQGMVGSALVRRLAAEDCEILAVDRPALDLTRQRETEDWIAANRPDAIIIAAAKVGGIHANNAAPGPFIYDNLAICSNIIHGAHKADVERLLVLGSVCAYPKFADEPVAEGSLLTGALEPTNEWYAVAKIAAIKMAEAYRRQYGRNYISAMPANLYGPNDNFDLETSHVLPALIRKAHEAKLQGDKTITIWGSGAPRREFLHVDDCADGLVHALKHHAEPAPINIGAGSDISILDLANLVCEVVGYHGDIALDRSKSDGTPSRLMDTGTIRALAWTPKIALREGIANAYQWYCAHVAKKAA